MVIILYSTDCPNCKRLKEMLDTNGKTYQVITDINIMKDKGINKVPVLEVNGEMFSYKEAFNLLLGGKI